MNKTSAWDIKDVKKYPRLKENLEADVVVVGGGLAGVWIAYLLSKEGKRVVLLEAKRLGSGATHDTTAFITHEIDTNLSDLVDMFTENNAKLIWESHKEAIDLIGKTVKEDGIDCEFSRTPLTVYAQSEDEMQELKEEHRTATTLGFKTFLKKNPNLWFNNEGAWVLPHQATYHPLAFLHSLANRAVENGVHVFEQTEVKSVMRKEKLILKTTDGTKIVTEHVVWATYKPFKNKNTHFKKGMYTSYVVEGRIPKGAVPEGMYLDMKDPYNYFRIDPSNETSDRIIFGGADHRSELKIPAQKNFNALVDTMKTIFPNIKVAIVNKWSGPILEPSDGLALIGEIERGEYIASAFSGNGMTYAAISGMLIRDLILNKENSWTHLYDPTRPMKVKPLLKKARDYAREFVGGAAKNIFK